MDEEALAAAAAAEDVEGVDPFLFISVRLLFMVLDDEFVDKVELDTVDVNAELESAAEDELFVVVVDGAAVGVTLLSLRLLPLLLPIVVTVDDPPRRPVEVLLVLF